MGWILYCGPNVRQNITVAEGYGRDCSPNLGWNTERKRVSAVTGFLFLSSQLSYSPRLWDDIRLFLEDPFLFLITSCDNWNLWKQYHRHIYKYIKIIYLTFPSQSLWKSILTIEYLWSLLNLTHKPICSGFECLAPKEWHSLKGLRCETSVSQAQTKQSLFLPMDQNTGLSHYSSICLYSTMVPAMMIMD